MKLLRLKIKHRNLDGTRNTVEYLTTKPCKHGLIVRKMDSVIHPVVFFPTATIKAMTPGILNSQEIKSDSNSKMLNFSIALPVTVHV